MSKKYRFKPASQQELSLYCFVGESVCAVQHVEDALSHSIVLKKTKPCLKSEADQLLRNTVHILLVKLSRLPNKQAYILSHYSKNLKNFCQREIGLFIKVLRKAEMNGI